MGLELYLGSKMKKATSIQVAFSRVDPNDTQDEPSKTVSSAVIDEFVQFLDLIRFPQRTALEYLLTDGP